jgi:hypothetical protein
VPANYRLAYDRIQTFVLSSFVRQSIPGLTLSVINTDFGQAGGRLPNLPKPAPPAGVKPSDLTQPAAMSFGSQTVVDPDPRSPKTNIMSSDSLSRLREMPA